MKKLLFVLLLSISSVVHAQWTSIGHSSDNDEFFIDYSKESEVIIKPCPDGDICPAVVEYVLDEETDQKFGAGILYNINKRSAVTLELISSKVLDSSLKIGYQINF